jgi:predicted Zn-dependent peptidase
MVLVIVGQMKVDSLIKVIEKNQNAKTLKPQLKPVFAKVSEPLTVKFKYRQIQMPISTKKIAIGYKLKPIDNLTNIQINKRLIAYSIYQDMLFSESAPFYQNLIKSKIITPTMDVSAFQGVGYNAMIIESEVLDEAKFIKAIDDQIKNANVGLMEKEFQIVKNLNVSEAIRSYESPQRLAINYMSNYFDGVNVFDDLDSIKNITLKDIVKVASEIRQAKKSVFVIKPMVKN